MDAQVDRELARICAETSEALGCIPKDVSGQLKQSRKIVDKLRAQVTEGHAHTERVRQQVEAIGHTPDARHADSAKKQAALSEIDRTDDARGVRLERSGDGDRQRGADVCPGRPAGPSRGAQSEMQGDEPDRAALSANTHADVGSAQVHDQFAAYLAAHTHTHGGRKQRWLEAGRSFVPWFGGTPAKAAQYADEAFYELHDGVYQRSGGSQRSKWAAAAPLAFTWVAAGPTRRWRERWRASA